MHGPEPGAGAARVEAVVEAYERILLVYAHVKARYGGARAEELGPEDIGPMQQEASMALDSTRRLIEAIKQLLAFIVAADPDGRTAYEAFGIDGWTDDQWLTLGMMAGRSFAAARGRGEGINLASLRSGEWM